MEIKNIKDTDTFYPDLSEIKSKEKKHGLLTSDPTYIVKWTFYRET